MNGKGKPRRMNLNQIIQKRHLIIEKSQRSKKNIQVLQESIKNQNQPSNLYDFLNSSNIGNSSKSNTSNRNDHDYHQDDGKNIVNKLNREKLKKLKKFKIFQVLEKGLQNYISYFQQIEYSREEIIYQVNQQVKGVYFIIQGQVISSIYKEDHVQEDSSRLKFNIYKRKQAILKRMDLYKLSQGNYFGQKQIIMEEKPLRSQTFRCYSAKCILIFINKQNFKRICFRNQDFQKKISNDSQIKYLIHKNNQMKFTSTLKKINIKKNPLSSLNSFFGEKQISNRDLQQRVKQNKSKSVSASVLKKRKINIMHGKQIKSYSDLQKNKKSSLQGQNNGGGYKMLQADQQLYKQTQKKFRKYAYLRKDSKISKTQPNQPGIQSSRSLKTLWNLLRLDQLVDQQTRNYSSQEGKKYFYQHQRFKRRITQTKSIKPPLSSCQFFKRKNNRVIYQLIS